MIDMSVRELLAAYLRYVDEPRKITRIKRYMSTMHRVPAGAVRICLWRMQHTGVIVHVRRGYYVYERRSVARTAGEG